VSHVPQTAPPGLPPGRYGSPRRLPRWAAALLITLGVIALVPVARAALDRATPDTRATITGYTIESDNKVSAVVDVKKSAGSVATCTLRARDRFSDAVGTALVVVDNDRSATVVTRSFPTSDRAVVVEITGCTSTDRP